MRCKKCGKHETFRKWERICIFCKLEEAEGHAEYWETEVKFLKNLIKTGEWKK